MARKTTGAAAPKPEPAPATAPAPTIEHPAAPPAQEDATDQPPAATNPAESATPLVEQPAEAPSVELAKLEHTAPAPAEAEVAPPATDAGQQDLRNLSDLAAVLLAAPGTMEQQAIGEILGMAIEPAPAARRVPELDDFITSHERAAQAIDLVVTAISHPDAKPRHHAGVYSGFPITTGELAATYSDGSTH